MGDAFDPNKYLEQKSQLLAKQPLRQSQPVMDEAPAGGGGFDPNKYLQEKSAEQEPGLLRKGLDYGIRALDYPGGLLRTGLAGAAGALSGKTVATEDDVGNAFIGKAPSSSTYLERLGVSPGPSVDLPWVGNVSLRDAEGLGLDIATDPLTAVAKGIKWLRPADAAAEVGGKALFRSGLKKVDERLVEKGAAPVSDLLMEEGKWGRTKTLAKDTKEIGNKANAERAALYAEADKAGATVDMSTALEKTEAAIAKMASNPGLEEKAAHLQSLVDKYKKAGKVSLEKASEWKSELYDALPESALGPNGRPKGAAAKVQKAMAKDFKNAIVSEGNKAAEGLGDKVHKLNETMQTTIQAETPMKMQVRRANTTNAFSATDPIIGGMALATSHNPYVAAAVLAAKKAGDISKTTAFRTGVGQGLIRAGKSGVAQGLVNRGLINANREGPSEEELEDLRRRGLLSGGE